MKIVHILLGTANPESMNGVNKVVHFLATEQQRAGHDVEVWGLTHNPNRLPSHKSDYRLRLFPVTKSRLALAASLKSALKALAGDVWIQLHSVFVPEFRAIAAVLNRRDIAFGITPHGGYSQQVFKRGVLRKAAYYILIESGVVRRAKLFHAIGLSEVGDIRRIAPQARVALVPNGQEQLRRPPSLHRGFQHDDQRPIFVFCGRLAMEHKGLDLLIEGFHLYRQAGEKGTLWLIGDGQDRAVLEGLASRLRLGASIRFHGAQYGDEKLALISSGDAFVHTSRWDGVPTAALEGAALGLPLVVSQETNLGDAVSESHAGVVLRKNTPEDIAAALLHVSKLMVQGNASAMGTNAARMVAEHFSWSSIANLLITEYQAAAAKHRSQQ